MSPLDADAQAVVAFLNAAASEHFLYESVGVFWLAAEVLILFAIREGRKQVAGETPSPWLPRLLLWMLAFAVPATLVLTRQHLQPDPPIAEPEELAFYYIQMAVSHLAIWSLFVLGWVVLEAAIVFEGVRAYGHFTRLCRHALRPIAVVALCCMAWNIAAQEMLPPPSPGMAAMHEADAALQPLRNAVYLYLRIAGVAWIAVEWVAAVLLWRGQSLLWRVVRERAHD